MEIWHKKCNRSIVLHFRKMLHRHPLLPYTLVHPMHYEEERGYERESVLVWGSHDHMSDFCMGVKGCIVT